MPNYRSGSDEYRRRPKMNYERSYAPEPVDDEEDEDLEEEDLRAPMKEPAKEMKPPKKKEKECICKVECPFKIIVKVIPMCEEHKEKEKDYPCEDD